MWKNIISGIVRKNTVRTLTPVVSEQLLQRQEDFTKRQKEKEAKWGSDEEYGIFYSYPSLAAYYGTIGPFFSGMIILCLMAFVVIVFMLLGVSIFESGWWDTVNDIKSMLAEVRWYHVAGMGLFIALMGGLLCISPVLTKYMENTVTIFSSKCIYVRRYRQKDVIVTYDELAENIKFKKILIKNGKYIIPCKGRNIGVCANKEQYPKELFDMLQKRCSIKLPLKNESQRANATGAGRACGHLGGGICLGFGLVISMMIFLFEGRFTMKMLCFDLFTNPLLWMAVGLLALGLLLNIFTIMKAVNYYRAYKSTIRVSWQPVILDTVILILVIVGCVYLHRMMN